MARHLCGQNISSSDPRSPDDELEEHLLDIAHLFILGGDTARADVILEYAKDFFGSDIYYDSNWKPIIDGIQNYQAPSIDVPPMAERKISHHVILKDSADFADAVSTMARAKSFGTTFKPHWKDSYPLAYDTVKELEAEEETNEADAGVPEEEEETSWWREWMPNFRQTRQPTHLKALKVIIFHNLRALALYLLY